MKKLPASYLPLILGVIVLGIPGCSKKAVRSGGDSQALQEEMARGEMAKGGAAKEGTSSGKASFYPLPASVEKAFAESQVLAVEADITNAEAIAEESAAMTYVPPDGLSKHLPAPLLERLRRQLQRFGMPEAQVEPVKPFFVASLLVFNEWFRQGYLPNQGVDLHLINRAKKAKMSLVELEGAQAQTRLMASLSEKEGVQALEGAISSLESGLTRDQITGVVNGWQSGDPGLLLEVTRAYNEAVPGSRELEEKFIWSRHEAMAGRIEAFLLSGRERAFVAVGALHLAGPRGLVEILAPRDCCSAMTTAWPSRRCALAGQPRSNPPTDRDIRPRAGAHPQC